MNDIENKLIIEPTKQQLDELLKGEKQGPFHFVNLLKFKPLASYPADHELAEKDVSGEEAYRTYGRVAHEHITKRGGRLITLNNVKQQLIGNSTQWHQIATMEYPTVDAFIDMISDPDYVQSLIHREAGLEMTEVFVTRPIVGTHEH